MSIIANAVALTRLGFDYDIAYLSAWYGAGKIECPTATPYQVLAWMEQVKHIPIVSEEQAELWLQAYTAHKTGAI